MDTLLLRRRAARWLLVALLACGPALGASFGVSPVRVELDAKRHVAVVQLTNHSTQPLSVQAEARPWPADAGGPALVVNPPIATLAPGATQTVRIGLRERPAGAVERGYRVYFTELPAPSAQPASGATLGVALRVGIPVFVAPLRREPQPLRWRLLTDPPALEVHNPGNVHHVLQRPLLRDGERQTELRPPSPYLLAGQTQRLPLGAPPTVPADALSVTLDGPAGRAEHPVRVD